MEDALPACFVQNPRTLLVPKFWIEGIKPFFPATYPVPQGNGGLQTPADQAHTPPWVSLSLHLSFLLQAGQAPELLKEIYSKTATMQSRTHPTNMTMMWCYFPTHTFKMGQTLAMVLHHRSSHDSPGCLCSTSAVPQGRRCGEHGLQRWKQVLRMWQEMPSTLPLSHPAQSQNRRSRGCWCLLTWLQGCP